MEISSRVITYTEKAVAEYVMLTQFCRYGAVPPNTATATA